MKFLFEASFTVTGLGGLIEEGPLSRRESAEKLFAELGGSVEALYYALGSTDLYVIMDLPDMTTAAAVTMFTNAAGAAVQRTVVLLSPEELERARSIPVNYRPPGKDAPKRWPSQSTR